MATLVFFMIFLGSYLLKYRENRLSLHMTMSHEIVWRGFNLKLSQIDQIQIAILSFERVSKESEKLWGRLLGLPHMVLCVAHACTI